MKRRVALLAALVLAPLAAAQMTQSDMEPPAPPPGLSIVTGVDGYLDVMPGATRTLNVTLRNDGNETLDLSLDAFETAGPDAPRHLTIALAERAVSLAPNASRVVAIDLAANADAPINATTRLVVLASRPARDESMNAFAHVRVGEPCPSCVPPEGPGPGNFVVRGGGPNGQAGGPTGSSANVVRGPSGAMRTAGPNASAGAPEPADDYDPYQEVPAPGVVALLGAAALAARARRSPRLTCALVLLALLAPVAAAQSAPASERAFTLLSATREGDDVLLSLRHIRDATARVILSVHDERGTLLAPEQLREGWFGGQTLEHRFAIGKATQIELRLHYTRENGTYYSERFPIQLPAAPRAQIEVVRAAVSSDLDLAVTLTNTGSAASGTIVASLEDERGTRIGEPLARVHPGIAAGESATLAFRVDDATTTLVLVLDEANATRRIRLEVERAGAGERLILERASVLDDGTARFTLAAAPNATIANAVAHLETTAGLRVGSPASLPIGDIAGGSSAEIAFALPSDVSDVRLVVQHRDGNVTFPVRLDEDDASGGSRSDLELATDLPSREGQVAGSATWQMTLKNDGPEALVELRADGLPSGYTPSFSVGGSSARSLVIPRGEERQVSLTVAISQAASRDADKTLDLSVVASVDGAEAARAALSLTVRGAPRLELQGQNWFATIAQGGSATVSVTLRNTGSAEARDLDMAVSAPAGWDVSFAPQTIETLGPGESREIDVTVTPPADVGSGRYVLDISAAGTDLSARARSLSVEVPAESSSRLGWLAGVGIAGLAATALIVKLRRR